MSGALYVSPPQLRNGPGVRNSLRPLPKFHRLRRTGGRAIKFAPHAFSSVKRTRISQREPGVLAEPKARLSNFRAFANPFSPKVVARRQLPQSCQARWISRQHELDAARVSPSSRTGGNHLEYPSHHSSAESSRCDAASTDTGAPRRFCGEHKLHGRCLRGER